MFTQHLVKNLQWLFAAVQFFSPTQLSRFLVVVMTTFMLQIGFVNEVFAEDVTTTIDTTATLPTDLTTVDITVAPSIRFVLNEDNSVSLEVTGVDLDSEVSGFTFENSDITPLIQQMMETGVMQKQTDPTKRTFALKFGIENPKSLENGLFGIVLMDGTSISKRIKLEDVSSTKGSNIDWNRLVDQFGQAFSVAAPYISKDTGISSVSGTFRKITGRTCSWLRCTNQTQVLSGKSVKLSIKGTPTGESQERWMQVATGNTDSFGYYTFGAKSGSKGYCGPIKLVVDSYEAQAIPYFCKQWWSSVSVNRDF